MDKLPASVMQNDFPPTDLSALIGNDQEFETSEILITKKESPIRAYILGVYDRLINIINTPRKRLAWSFYLTFVLILMTVATVTAPVGEMIGSILPGNSNLTPLKSAKPGYEVFGFAPHWTFNKLDNVDFQTLTTLAYFGVEAKPDGNLDREGKGYEVFMSDKATEVFKRAHSNGTRVVLTLTQMNNDEIKKIMDDEPAQESIINQTIETVKNRGIDGVNIDFEYVGDPGSGYKEKFTKFSKNLADKLHSEVPGSRVTASVYASAVTKPKMYDIKNLSDSLDGIFMMAYDFAVAGSSNAIPTAPLYGHKEGKYWYDISTAVDDFLTQMPPDKLILGVPWYGYNYAVESPEVKTATTKGYYISYKKGRRTYKSFVPLKSFAQTYTLVKNVTPDSAQDYREGFDEYGKVSWKAYLEGGIWRMVFIDDVKSLSHKYDFAKEKNLAGVGMWALGFDNGNTEFWDLLKDKFGTKTVADSSVVQREIK
jgi:spore germination protein